MSALQQYLASVGLAYSEPANVPVIEPPEPTFLDWLLGIEPPQPVEPEPVPKTFASVLLETFEEVSSPGYLQQRLADSEFWLKGFLGMIICLTIFCVLKYVFRFLTGFSKSSQPTVSNNPLQTTRLELLENKMTSCFEAEQEKMDSLLKTNLKVLERTENALTSLVDTLNEVLQSNQEKCGKAQRGMIGDAHK